MAPAARILETLADPIPIGVYYQIPSRVYAKGSAAGDGRLQSQRTMTRNAAIYETAEIILPCPRKVIAIRANRAMPDCRYGIGGFAPVPGELYCKRL
jgi:hypothetical protein